MTLFIARWTLGWPKEALAVAEIYIKFMALEKVNGSTGSGMTGREVRPICCKTEEKEQRRQ